MNKNLPRPINWEALLRRLENQPAPAVDSVTEDLLRWIGSEPAIPAKSDHATESGAPHMTKKSKPSVEVLSDLMQRSLSKDPALAAKQSRLLEKLKSDTSLPPPAGSTPSPQVPETSSEATSQPDLDSPAEVEAWQKHRERQRTGQMKKQTLAEQAFELAKVTPPIKRGTVEESLMRSLELQEPPAGDTKVDLVALWNLLPSSDAHKNPRPLVDSDICLAAQELGWMTPRYAGVLWESQRLKERFSQTPFYAQRVATRGALVWLELSQSYQGTV